MVADPTKPPPDHALDAASLHRPTHTMQPVPTPPRFENISARVVRRVDPPVLGPDSMVGPYRIRQQIGCGAMGQVFEAVHPLLPRRVAIKLLHARLHGNAGMDERLVQEATILDQLYHPGVARVFDCGLLADGRPWIAMELVAGESLACKLAREPRLPAAEVCKLVAAIADVLATAHPRGIVHRDLKPDNILFAEAESGFPLRVIDWGVARLGAEARLTLEGVTCGTPVYMSPEQTGGHDIAPPCDIYSLGVIAYEALAGVAPFEGVSLAEIVSLHRDGDAAPLTVTCPGAPVGLCELVHRMLHKNPAYRPVAAEVRQRMQELASMIADCEFESYEVTASPWLAMAAQPLDDTLRLRRPRWTPEHSMTAGSGYSMIRPPRGRTVTSGEIRNKS